MARFPIAIAAAVLCGAGALAVGLAAEVQTQPPPAPALAWSDADARCIAAHGPWPQSAVRDPSNRVSGKPAAIAFGARLFVDKRLSRPGTVACATCHQPERAFADGVPRGHGIAVSERNTPGLDNIGARRWYGWDGAHDNLWAQSLRPLTDPVEMGNDFAAIGRLVREDTTLRTDYLAAFGSAPRDDDDEALVINLTKALAAFQETLVTGRTPFDAFRDALVAGDRPAMARYPMAAQRGALLFVGKGRCNICHAGPLFTNGEFHDTGIPHFTGPGKVDAGRHGGIRKLQSSRHNLLGAFNDDAAKSTAVTTRHVALEHRNFGEFKVPSLRNVARTAPYMHNGSLATLRDVVRHYSELDENRLHADGEAILKPLRLTDQEAADLVAFLESLSQSAGKPP
ncbi:MAG: cytochrome c peroxidase [Rubrivivax sp.]